MGHPGPSLKTQRLQERHIRWDGDTWAPYIPITLELTQAMSDEIRESVDKEVLDQVTDQARGRAMLGSMEVKEIYCRYDKTETGQLCLQIPERMTIPAGTNLRGDGSFGKGAIAGLELNGNGMVLTTMGEGDVVWGTDPSRGDLQFEFVVKSGDTLLITLAASESPKQDEAPPPSSAADDLLNGRILDYLEGLLPGLAAMMDKRKGREG